MTTFEGACASVDPEMFFPETSENANIPKLICNGCPIRLACLREALQVDKENGHRDGIWGGLSPHERSKYARSDEYTQAKMRRLPTFDCGHARVVANVNIERPRTCRTCQQFGVKAA